MIQKYRRVARFYIKTEWTHAKNVEEEGCPSRGRKRPPDFNIVSKHSSVFQAVGKRWCQQRVQMLQEAMQTSPSPNDPVIDGRYRRPHSPMI